MTSKQPPQSSQPGKAQHGPRSEVNWEGGSGRQPYTNQGTQEQEPATGPEYAEGDRAERSGRNLEQLERAKGKP